MSNEAGKRKSNQPEIPVVRPETMQALLAAARDFGEAAPWRWMHDSELLGLRDPATGGVLLCSILGRLKTVFALVVYRRDSGVRWILDMIHGVGSDDDDQAAEQDCIKVEYVRKGELTREDRALLAAAAYPAPRKSGSNLPVFRSMAPGEYPWQVTQEEAETLLFALPRAAAFGTLCRDTPGFLSNLATGTVPFLRPDVDPARGPLSPADLDWQPIVRPPEPAWREVSLDDATLARLRALPQAKGFHLELDQFHSMFPVVDGGRPYWPQVALAVDRASGMVGAFEMARSTPDGTPARLGAVLTKALTTFQHRPETIWVQRRRVAQRVVGVAAALGIAVKERSELEALNAARDSILDRFRTGG